MTTAVQISRLDYKKNLSFVSPSGVSNTKQIIVFNGDFFFLGNADGKVRRVVNNVVENISQDIPVVRHLTTDTTSLYAATLGGLYIWQGNSQWTLIGPDNKDINRLVIFDGSIHAVNGAENNSVERWNGISWTQVGTLTGVRDFSIFSGQLHSGGSSGVRRWSGSAWVSLGTIANVNSLIIFNGQLHASTDSSGVQRWTGSTWTILAGSTGIIISMALFKNRLYATDGSRIYKRTGNDWKPMTPPNQDINTIYPLGSSLLAGRVEALMRLSSARFTDDNIDLDGHGLNNTNPVFVKCVTNGFVSRDFVVSNESINTFKISPAPTFVTRENLNYTRSGGLITVRYTGHGLDAGDKITIENPIDEIEFRFDSSTVNSVIDDNTFTVSVTNTGPLSGDNLKIQKRSGEVLVSDRLVFSNAQITTNSSGDLTLTQTNHGLVKGDSIYVKVPSDVTSFDSSPAIVESVISQNQFTVVKKMNPGSFYNKYGVKAFHDKKIYGKGVSIYIIDEGFNDVDPNIPGIQPISDLGNFEMVDFGTPGAGTSLSHGALVGALVGASRTNGAGIIGVSPDAKLYIADVDDTQGSIFIPLVVNAIDDAISRGVDIINMSLGTSFASSALGQAVQRAINANILVVASAGNSGSGIYEYPASFDGVISVASVNYEGQPSTFNTRNEKVAIFAPGEDYPLPSPISESNVVRVDGTSFSAPFASGMIALYIQDQRIKRGDSTWRPTRQEIVQEIPKLLGTQSLSFPAPGFQQDELFAGDLVETLAYVMIGFIGVVIVAFMALKFVK